MASAKVVGFAAHKTERDCERKFLSMIDTDIKSNPDHVHPLPQSMFDRFEAIEARIAKHRDEDLMEG